jgi:hypothetical protein
MKLLLLAAVFIAVASGVDVETGRSLRRRERVLTQVGDECTTECNAALKDKKYPAKMFGDDLQDYCDKENLDEAQCGKRCKRICRKSKKAGGGDAPAGAAATTADATADAETKKADATAEKEGEEIAAEATEKKQKVENKLAEANAETKAKKKEAKAVQEGEDPAQAAATAQKETQAAADKKKKEDAAAEEQKAEATAGAEKKEAGVKNAADAKKKAEVGGDAGGAAAEGNTCTPDCNKAMETGGDDGEGWPAKAPNSDKDLASVCKEKKLPKTKCKKRCVQLCNQNYSAKM